MGKVFKNQKLQKAFTVIELLVVIAVIGLLATIIIVRLGSLRAGARDSKRVTEVNSLRIALELYYTDSGEYPKSTEDEEWCSLEGAGERPECTELVSGITPLFPQLPGDPLFGQGKEPTGRLYSYQYISTSSGQGYMLHADLEGGGAYEISSYYGGEMVYAPPGGGGGGVGAYWAEIYGGEEGDSFSSIQQTSDGGYIAVGETENFSILEPPGPYCPPICPPQDPSQDWFILKLDSDGIQIWGKGYGSTSKDSASQVLETSGGDYVIVGTIDNDPDNVGIEFDIYVQKLDSDGNEIWTRAYGDSVVETGGHIATISDGYIITGTRGSWGHQIAILKIDSDSTFDWERIYGPTGGSPPPNTIANSILPLDGGNSGYIMAGYTDYYGNGEEEALILKVSSNGWFDWARAYGGSEEDNFKSIRQTSDGGYIAVGKTKSYGQAGSNILVVKLGSDYSIEWKKTYGSGQGEVAYSVQEIPGGYIVGGNSCLGLGPCGALILKLESDGTKEWAKIFSGDGYEHVYSIQQTSDEGYIAAGDSYSSFATGENGLVLKLNSAGNIPDCSYFQDVSGDIVEDEISEDITTTLPNLYDESLSDTSKDPIGEFTAIEDDISTSICPE